MVLAKNLNKNNQSLMGLILLLRLFILWTVVPFQALGLPFLLSLVLQCLTTEVKDP